MLANTFTKKITIEKKKHLQIYLQRNIRKHIYIHKNTKYLEIFFSEVAARDDLRRKLLAPAR